MCSKKVTRSRLITGFDRSIRNREKNSDIIDTDLQDKLADFHVALLAQLTQIDPSVYGDGESPISLRPKYNLSPN